MLLLDHFAELTDAPGAAAHLRRLILDLAVRGKLVAQDERDEPASVLLERIGEERARRVAAGELKRARTQVQAKLAKGDEPYELPVGWVWCRLGDIYSMTSGGTPTRGENSFWGGEIPWLKSGELNDGLITQRPTEYITQLGLDKSSATLFPRGTLLIALYGATAGKLGILDFETTSNQAVCGLLENPLIDTTFTFNVLKAFRKTIIADSWGQAQLNISQTYLKKFLFPLPPLPEQHRIVARTEALLTQLTNLERTASRREELADALIPALLNGLAEAGDLAAYWRETIAPNFGLFTERPAYCDQLRRLILDLAVRGKLAPQQAEDEPATALLARIREERARRVRAGEIRKGKKLAAVNEAEVPFGLPAGWVWCRLGEIALVNPKNDIADGTMASFVPMKSISETYGTTPDTEDRLWSSIKRGYTHFQEGDVAIAKITPCYENGKAAIFKNLRNGVGAGTTELYILRSLLPEQVLPEYLYLQIKNRTFVLEGEKIMTGSSGQKRVPKSFLSNYIIALPPLPEQRRIVARTERLLARVDELRLAAERRGELREGVWRALVG